MNLVIVLDFGSQYTQLIARRVRELGIYSEILPYTTSAEKISSLNPSALILSGGPASVYAKRAPLPDPKIYDLMIHGEPLPMLGICYGLQAMAQQLGGKVINAEKREFGRSLMKVDTSSRLFNDVPESQVWMSHGDKVVKLPQGFAITATTDNSEMCAAENPARNMYGLQFHPEVHHTEHG
ncbi:MAG: glutamine-hydrolyzing GMP synthase, partial [Rhizobacter sp.]|nr:glutamine-hydrolyzing GMP synthase [Chlorobiales bacterium]